MITSLHDPTTQSLVGLWLPTGTDARSTKSTEIKICTKKFKKRSREYTKMAHLNLDKTISTTPMLPKDGDEKMVVITPANGVGKILIREDTILANLHGCAGCGRGQFTCGGVKSQWSVLCWGKQPEKKYYCCK